MTKIGLTSGKLNRRVVVVRENAQHGNTYKEKAGKSYDLNITRWCQVFFKRQTSPIEALSLSDKQEYMFNFRFDYYTNQIDQRCTIVYNNQDYSVKNVDKFNVGLVSVTAVKVKERASTIRAESS